VARADPRGAPLPGRAVEGDRRGPRLLAGLGEGDTSIPLSAFKGSLPWPTPGRVRIGFGKRRHPRFETYTLHNGIEIEASESAPVAAVYDGTVVYADRFQGYGLMVALDHGSHHHSLYAHLSEIAVQTGQKVSGGERLGSVGVSELGASGLYFEIRFQGQAEDPLEWLKPAPKAAPARQALESPRGLGMMDP
jgi:septal ring factor EnvC (AmiA/AmiB activator)